MTTSTVKQLRRIYNGEDRWFPLLEELGHRRLRRGLIEAGIPASTAAGLVFFLEDQMHLDRHQAEKSRNRYRSVLNSLDPATVADLATRAIPGSRNLPWSEAA